MLAQSGTWEGPGGIPDDHALGLDVTGHHRPCADQRTAPDPDPTRYHRSGSKCGSPLDRRRQRLPVALALQPTLCRRTWILVVGEQHPVTDEHLVLDVHPATDE